MKRSAHICIVLLLTAFMLPAQRTPEYASLVKKADSLLHAKNYKLAAFTYSDAFKSFGWKGFTEDRYKAAAAWALAGYPDSAFYNLQRIADKVAYADVKRVSSDSNFVGLRRNKKWKPLLAKIKSNADSLAAIDTRLDKNLIHKLDSMKKEDQKWRNLMTRWRNSQMPKDSIDKTTILSNMVRTDSMNSLEVRKIFYKYGFPDYSIAGQSGSHNFWLIVQHQDRHPAFQDSVLTSMKIAAEKGKADWTNYAYLIDRVKVNTGQMQIYGTQMQVNKESTSYEPRPVIEPEKLNERRKSVGLGTIEEYIEVMNSNYFGTLNKK